MSLQTVMQNRRKFLERSLLGAGSVLFLPAIVGGCTDHRIPEPGTDPDLFDPKIDWNDDAKIVVKTGLEMIPEAGEILGGLVDIFWPSSKEDVWGQVKEQVEAIVDQRIADGVYQQVSEDLKGLNNSTVLYLNEVKNGTPLDIKTQWIATRNSFAEALPHFQSAGYELPLVGLFGQFAGLYLAILRDGVISGKDWGRSAADQQQDIKDLQKAISVFSDYAANTVITGAGNLAQKTKRNDHLCEPFRTTNTFLRQMTLTVIDFINTWPYYDVTKYPIGTTVVLNRVIYSDPYGTCDDTGNIVTAYPYPTQRPTNLTVWGHDRIDAVQVTYPAGSGPGGITTTNRMGGSGGDNTVFGGSYNLSRDNPILYAKVTHSNCVNALRFMFNDKTITKKLGGNYAEGGESDWLGYTNECLSSIHINGISNFYGTADCVVFGFQFWQSPSTTLRAIGAIYVKSPKEHSATDFAKVFPNFAIPATLITEELKLARKAYWAYIKARAEALK